MEAIITVGISASGKTTWANNAVKNKNDWVVLCRDDVRQQILESELNRPLQLGELWTKWKWKREREVSAIIDIQLQECVLKRQNVIFADTNLNVDRRKQLEKRLEDLGFKLTVIMFDVSLEDAWLRDAARPNGVGHEVIFKQWMQFQDMKNFGEKYIPVPNLPKAIMVDIDGTLAITKDRSPFEWSKVGQDDLNQVVYHIVRGYYNQGFTIVIMSGRDSVCRKETEDWLAKHNVPYHEMLMRAKDDVRKDSVVKRELFWQQVAPNYDVEAVFDDRNQVIHMWMALGLKVIHCGNPWDSF